MAILLGAGAACGSSEPVQTPTSITLASSTALSGVVGEMLSDAPAVVVNDQNGNPISGIALTIVVTPGGGTLASPATTTAKGPTPLGTYTLGTVAGTNTITVSAAGLAPLVIQITARAGAPAALAVLAGDKQTALAGTRVSPIQLAVKDRFGNGVTTATPATFAVIAGGGRLAAQTVTADAAGIIAVPAWDLGRSVLPQVIRATLGTFTVDVTATVRSEFNVDVRFFGAPMSPAQQTLFANAAARINAMIVGDIIGVRTGSLNLAEFCGMPGLPIIDEVVDDVIIYAAIQPIDGPGKILAQAGPCATRSAAARHLPVIGIMSFDEADLERLTNGGSLQDVITHEMLHVVGFGTLWNASTNLFVSKADTTNPRYTGAGGVQGCREVGGSVSCAETVPLENTGGQGTRDSHWRESVFDTELMTGFAERSGAMPVSVMTVRALGDLSYVINPDAADPYTIAIGSLQAVRAGPDAPLEEWETSLPGDGVIIGPGGTHTRGAPIRKHIPR